MASRVPAAARFEQEPGAPFGFVNPVLDKAGASDVVVIVADAMSLTPRGVRYMPTILSAEQAKSLLIFVTGHQHEALYTVALTLGLRRGETLGLGGILTWRLDGLKSPIRSKT
jgi:hypothetical protein